MRETYANVQAMHAIPPRTRLSEIWGGLRVSRCSRSATKGGSAPGRGVLHNEQTL